MMRCLALAQGGQEAGNSVIFLTRWRNPLLEARFSNGREGEIKILEAVPGSREDAKETAKLARMKNATWVIADGYHFNAPFQKELKQAGERLLLIDDLGHCEHYYADLILNQNLHADERMYSRREPQGRLLLGTHYVLLRNEFRKWRGWKRETPEAAKNLLVTLGGGDPENLIFKIVQALSKIRVPDLELVIVVGGMDPSYELLQEATRVLPFQNRLERDVRNISDLMAWADIAVSAAGSTAWEMAFMGLPSLLLILAENQRSIAEGLDQRGAAINWGGCQDISAMNMVQALTELIASAPRRAEMTRHAQGLVDGEGAQRVLAQLEGKEKILIEGTRR